MIEISARKMLTGVFTAVSGMMGAAMFTTDTADAMFQIVGLMVAIGMIPLAAYFISEDLTNSAMNGGEANDK